MSPIAPYSWEARYETGRLLQRDVDGWHTSREIDRQRLRTLIVHGHPDSPITLPLPRPPFPFGPAPDEIIVRGTTDLHVTMAQGLDDRELRTARWVFVGLRYAAQGWLVQLDPAGHVLALVGYPLPSGSALDPVPCPQCNGREDV